MTRTEAYRWLAAKMKRKSAHISEMGQSDCYKVQAIANRFLTDKLFNQGEHNVERESIDA